MSDDDLARFAADARADEAARARAREQWLRRQAQEEGALAGLVLDLAEAGTTVVACTTGGRRHRGVVVAVGNPFVVLATASGRPVLLTFDGLAWLRAAPGEGVPPAGDRAPVLGRSVGEAIEELAGEGGRLQLVPGDPALAVTGEVLAVGRDVVTVQVDGEPGGLVYVRMDALTEVQSPES